MKVANVAVKRFRADDHGALDSRMAEANINIATFRLGRQAPERDAIAIVGVDQIVHDIVQQRLRALPHSRYMKALKF